YVVDASDYAKIDEAGAELHKLVSRGMSRPVLVLANKIDKRPHLTEDQLVERMGLDELQTVPWLVMPVSATEVTGIDSVVEWLCTMSK
ncbi:hypothetical protein TeGR_g6927, partial [Tetraparma gracilis]